MYAEPSTGKPKLIIFASGAKESGGSGFENLVRASREEILDADIVAVASNHEHGSVRNRADRLGIKFIYFPGPYESENYTKIITDTGADWIALSGWFQMVKGLDPAKTFNIHPALLSCLGGRFGGKGMYGNHVHEAVMEAFRDGTVTHSAVTMHFVTPVYDEGPIFFQFPVEILPDDTPESLGARVNMAEHEWQPRLTNMVVNGEISWDGRNPNSLKVPNGYKFL